MVKKKKKKGHKKNETLYKIRINRVGRSFLSKFIIFWDFPPTKLKVDCVAMNCLLSHMRLFVSALK